jgi:hypothetical protein
MPDEPPVRRVARTVSDLSYLVQKRTGMSTRVYAEYR